jgi:hypothetical protein
MRRKHPVFPFDDDVRRARGLTDRNNRHSNVRRKSAFGLFFCGLRAHFHVGVSTTEAWPASVWTPPFYFGQELYRSGFVRRLVLWKPMDGRMHARVTQARV